MLPENFVFKEGKFCPHCLEGQIWWEAHDREDLLRCDHCHRVIQEDAFDAGWHELPPGKKQAFIDLIDRVLILLKSKV
jgi:hypothetical protein